MSTLRSINRLRAFVVVAAVVVAAVTVSAAPAWAHASLLSSDPADGQTLEEAPEQLVLEFSEELDLPSIQVALVAPSGETVDLPPLSVDGNVLVQDVGFPEPGAYTFSFRIVSADGHPVEDSIEFTVSSVPETQDPVDSGSEAGEPTQAQESAAADSDSGVSWGTVGLIAVAVVVVVGLGLLAVRMARRRT